MLNREFYEKDPRTNILLNNGVAKVTTGQSDPEIDTLRYEVSNFVCELDQQFPFWLFFLSKRHRGLQCLLFCFLPPFLTEAGRARSFQNGSINYWQTDGVRR